MNPSPQSSDVNSRVSAYFFRFCWSCMCSIFQDGLQHGSSERLLVPCGRTDRVRTLPLLKPWKAVKRLNAHHLRRLLVIGIMCARTLLE